MCAVCGGRAVHRHHVVLAQHVRAKGGNLFDLDNFLLLCQPCHFNHHAASKRIPLAALRDENFDFAKRLMGLGAYDNLRRYYSGEDDRLYELLEEDAA